MNALSIGVLVATLVTCHVSLLSASEPERGKDRQLRLWQLYYQEVANSYEFRLQSQPNERLQVSPQPVHVYSNPASGFGTHGRNYRSTFSAPV